MSGRNDYSDWTKLLVFMTDEIISGQIDSTQY